MYLKMYIYILIIHKIILYRYKYKRYILIPINNTIMQINKLIYIYNLIHFSLKSVNQK